MGVLMIDMRATRCAGYANGEQHQWRATPMKTKTGLKLVCQDAYKHPDERINMSVHKSSTAAKWLAVVNAFPDVEGFAISQAQRTVAHFALGRMPK